MGIIYSVSPFLALPGTKPSRFRLAHVHERSSLFPYSHTEAEHLAASLQKADLHLAKCCLAAHFDVRLKRICRQQNEPLSVTLSASEPNL